jgi:hypothetical protein
MPTIDDVAAALAGEPQLWWGSAGKHGWVVLDRRDTRNSSGEVRHVLRCRDWVEFTASRQEFASDQFVGFKKHLAGLAEAQREKACAQLLALLGEFLARPPQEEINWLTAPQPAAMLAQLRQASARKCRLFATACCRRVWHLMDFEDCRAAVSLAERLAENEATPAQALWMDTQLRETYNSDLTGSMNLRRWSLLAGIYVLRDPRSWGTVRGVEELLRTSEAGRNVVVYASPQGSPEAEEGAQADLVREVFGNPYRPVTFHPHWRTPDVLYLARAVYAERAFDQLPILADALEEAGCASAELLEHLRLRGTAHVRGCWALDLVLGKQ